MRGRLVVGNSDAATGPAVRVIVPPLLFRSSDLPFVILMEPADPLFLRGFQAVPIWLRVYPARHGAPHEKGAGLLVKIPPS